MTELDRYVGGLALKFFTLAAATLVSLFSLLEFVDQLRSVGEGHYTVVDALVYVALTVPFRLLQLAPVSMLLATLLALGGMARHSELLVLRGSGVSELRIVAPVVKLALPLMAVLFLLAQFVIPPAQMLAQSRRSSALYSSESINKDNVFWAHSDDQYVSVQGFENNNIPRNVDIYEFESGGELKDIIHADRADIRPDGTWLLAGVVMRSFNGSTFRLEHLNSMVWSTSIPTDLLVLPPESMPPIALYRYVRDLEQRHQQPLRYELELWVKASLPLTIIGMIMIATPFVFGLPRAQNSGRLLAVGAICGVVFTLCQQIVWHLGLLLDLNPAVTALAPSLMLLALAAHLFRRIHR
jgi:lipopolysaccharide export system permease protein